MGSRQTWFWSVLAFCLFCFIFFYQRHTRNRPSGPASLLPSLRLAAVTNIQIRPAGQLEIRAERTNGVWVLASPIIYPAQSVSIQSLLAVLQRVVPAAHISGSELKNRPNADEEYGFTNPQASIIVQQPKYRAHLLVGARTAPGDQVFVQLVGADGAYVVDADLLRHLPRSASDWRDTTLVNLKSLTFDRLTVTNSSRMFELRQDPTNHLWRMTWPIQARADPERLEESLQKLQNLRIQTFVSDDPAADLESFGLQPAELQLGFHQGTQQVAALFFGKGLTNDSRQVYARRLGQSAITTVDRDLLAVWRAPVNDFRDPNLVSISEPVTRIDCQGIDQFTLLQTNGAWKVLPSGYPADTNTIRFLLAGLDSMRIVQFFKDVVTEQDFTAYGLSAPSVRFKLLATPAATNGPALHPQVVLADVSFGTNQEDRVFVRRADESSVYTVKLDDLRKLPTASWHFRETRIFDFSVTNVLRATIRQGTKVRQLIRNGPHNWALAPGSQGMINDLAVEETVKGLARLASVEWIAKGSEYRDQFGFAKGHLVELELKNGEKAVVEFGDAPSNSFPLAGVTLDNQFWIFKFPLLLHRDIESYLSIPADVP